MQKMQNLQNLQNMIKVFIEKPPALAGRNAYYLNSRIIKAASTRVAFFIGTKNKGK